MLKKSELLAGAVAAAAAVLSQGAFAAELKGSVNGDLRYALDSSDSNADENGFSATAQDLDLRDNNSWMGVKGSVGEGSLKAFGVYNVNLANDGAAGETTREGYIGLTGGFGTITAGDQFTAYMMSAHMQDPFRNTSLASTTGGVPDAAGAFGSYGQSGLTAEVIGGGLQINQIAYATPSLGGVTLNAVLFVDEDADGTTPGTGEESHDYGAGAAFNIAGINAGVQYLQINDEVGIGTLGGNLNGTGDGSATRLHASFAQENFGVGVSLERINEQTSTPGAEVLDQDYAFVSAWFGVMPGTRLAASYGMTNETGFEGSGLSLGVFQDVVQNFGVWAGGSLHDRKADSVNGGFGGSNDTYVVAIGATYKFDLGFQATAR